MLLLLGCLVPAVAQAIPMAIRMDMPVLHVVKKGDTLWDLSDVYLSDPWKWQDIWEFNKRTIRHPHWIYPGQVVVLGPHILEQPASGLTNLTPFPPAPPAPAPLRGSPLAQGRPAPAQAPLSQVAPAMPPLGKPPLIVRPMPIPVISARVISIYGGVSQAGPRTIFVIDKGRRDGVENGLILVLHRGDKTVGGRGKSPPVADAGYGRMQVFRTFDKTAYTTAMQASSTIKLMDFASTQ